MLLACLPLSADLLCARPCTKKAPSFLIFNTEKHISVPLRGYLKALILYWLTQHCWKAALTQLYPRREAASLPSSDSSHHLSEGNSLQISAAQMAKNHHHKHLIPFSLSGGKLQIRPRGCHTSCPLLHTKDGQGGEAIAPQGTCQSWLPWANSAQGAIAIVRGNKEYFSSHWIHSISGLSQRSIQLLLCYFITRAPRAEVILTQHFFPSNNRFHSCFQRCWPVWRILAILTHPARVPGIIYKCLDIYNNSNGRKFKFWPFSISQLALVMFPLAGKKSVMPAGLRNFAGSHERS